MVKYSKGDVLNCKATLVAHQVNAFGVMGGGIAAAIWPLLTPESQNAYVEKCRHNAKLPVTEWMGSIQILDTKREELKICNLFTQFPAPVDGSFDLTAYNYLRQALDLLRVYAVFNDYMTSWAFLPALDVALLAVTGARFSASFTMSTTIPALRC